MVIPKGFIPEQDTDQLAVITEAIQGASFQQMVEYQRVVADTVSRDPDVESLVVIRWAQRRCVGWTEHGADGGAPQAAH